MNKKLQLDSVRVKKVQFGAETTLTDGILTLNKEELLDLIRSDLFETVDVKLAVPGESCRILGVHDITQPRCKADAPETSYSGLWGKLAPAGEGRTVALIVNKSGMGHCQLDAAYAFNWAEKMGMPAVVSLNAVSNDKPGDMLVISDPKIDAVVNSGRNYMLEHPRVDRLIGENTNVPSLAGIDPWGPFTHTTNYAYMGIWSQIGDFCATCDTDLQDAPETF